MCIRWSAQSETSQGYGVCGRNVEAWVRACQPVWTLHVSFASELTICVSDSSAIQRCRTCTIRGIPCEIQPLTALERDTQFPTYCRDSCLACRVSKNKCDMSTLRKGPDVWQEVRVNADETRLRLVRLAPDNNVIESSYWAPEPGLLEKSLVEQHFTSRGPEVEESESEREARIQRWQETIGGPTEERAAEENVAKPTCDLPAQGTYGDRSPTSSVSTVGLPDQRYSY
jgi:hypothetical protein